MFVLIIPVRIIPRRIEVSRIKRSLPWVMVYGRRKTGKTFLVENFIPYDKFFFVNRDGTVLDKESGEFYTYREFIKILREIIEDKTIVVDEFHRLPESFLDFLHALGIKGNLILITSTLWLAKKIIGRGQPLLGLVKPVKIDLVDEREILVELSGELRGKELVESSVYLREVMLIPFYRGGSIRDFLADFLYDGKLILKELVGEVFREEERELTNIYEGVLKAVADGKNISTEISSLLFSRGLLAKDNPGILQKYLNILTEMGILEKIKVFNKKKYRYFHKSPLLDLHYYLESKYSYTELDVPKKFIRRVVDEKLPRHVEQFFRNLLSKILGLQYQIIEERELEVDIALLEFKRLKLVGEVKWKNYVPRKEVKIIEEKFSKFKNIQKILIVPETSVLEKEPEDIEVWDIEKILEKSRESLFSENNAQ